MTADGPPELRGPGGFRLRQIRSGADTGGELLEMEATYGGSGSMPPEHLHPRQAERFEVLEGTVRTIIDGTERRYEEGEQFEVPPGTPHQMTGDGPARVRWQVSPALRTWEFFTCLYGGEPPPPGFNPLEEFSDEIRLVT